MPITPSPAVLRACDLLAHFVRYPAEAFSVSELARVVGVPRATCDSILQALALHRLVTRRDGDLRYELGAGGIVLGDAARIGHSALRAGSAEAETLARACGACIAVSVRDGDSARVAEVFDFASPFGLRARVGQSIPLVPPFGAVFVAWAADDAEAWLGRAEGTLEPHESKRYQRALETVRQRGYSVTVAVSRRPELVQTLQALMTTPGAIDARRARDEVIREMMHSEYLQADLEPGATRRVIQISAPIFDRDGRAVASMLLMGPEYDLTDDELRALADPLVRAAAAATRRAGGRATDSIGESPEPADARS